MTPMNSTELGLLDEMSPSELMDFHYNNIGRHRRNLHLVENPNISGARYPGWVIQRNQLAHYASNNQTRLETTKSTLRILHPKMPEREIGELARQITSKIQALEFKILMQTTKLELEPK